MKTPGCKPENVIIEHIDGMHQRPVVIGGKTVFRLKTPYAVQEYIRQVPHISYPLVIDYLLDVVVNKFIIKSVEIDCESNNQNYDNGEKGGTGYCLLQAGLCRKFLRRL